MVREGRIEEGRHQPQIRAERAEFPGEIELVLADDAVLINLVQRLLPPPRLAAMVALAQRCGGMVDRPRPPPPRPRPR